MYNYQLLPKLMYLTLTADNSQECWEDRLEFIGTQTDWGLAVKLEEMLSN